MKPIATGKAHLSDRAQTYLGHLDSPDGFEDWDSYFILADLLEEEGVPLFTTVRWMAVNKKRPDHCAFSERGRNWNPLIRGKIQPSYLPPQVYSKLKNQNRDDSLIGCIMDLHFALNGEQ